MLSDEILNISHDTSGLLEYLNLIKSTLIAVGDEVYPGLVFFYLSHMYLIDSKYIL